MTGKVNSAKVPREAWKTGAVWENKDQAKGKLLAVILGPSDKPDYKQVHMQYVSGYNSFQRGRVIKGAYSRSHMKKYFEFTGTTANPATLPEETI